MSALGRVLKAPGLIALMAGTQIAVAALLGSGVGTAVDLAMGRHSMPEDGVLAAVLELHADHPGTLAGYLQTLTGSGLFALLFWTVMAPAVILRLRGPSLAARWTAATVTALPGVIATTLWHLVFRGVLLVAAGLVLAGLMSFGDWSLAGLVAGLLVLAFSSCALDLARCNVVLHGACRPFAAAARGFREALLRPTVLAKSMLASVGQWGCVAGMLALAIDGLGAGHTIWWVRALAIVGVVLGLTRVAVAVGAGPYRPASIGSSPPLPMAGMPRMVDDGQHEPIAIAALRG